MKKVIICGGRNFNDYERLRKICDHILEDDDIIICGLAKGADLLGKKYAQQRGLNVIEFPADWNTYGKRAGFIRNTQMLDNCTHVLAFWDGISSGTKDTITKAKERNLPLKIVHYD